MRPKFFFAPIILLIVIAPGAIAQDIPDDTVAARAGEINLATGDVTFKRGRGEWQNVVAGDWMEPGDRINTGVDSDAEILLTPGSYLRLSPNTEVALDHCSLDQLRFSLLSGSVIVEAASFDKKARRLVTVATPKTELAIDHRGVYRFDAGASGVVTVEVEKGGLLLAGLKIGEGNKASIDNTRSTPLVQKLGKTTPDKFDRWSERRARALVEANKTLLSLPIVKMPRVYNSLSYKAASDKSIWGGACGGSWYFDPLFGGYTYLPAFLDATQARKTIIFRGYDELPTTVGDATLPGLVTGGQGCPNAFSGYGWQYPTFGAYRFRLPQFATLRYMMHRPSRGLMSFGPPFPDASKGSSPSGEYPSGFGPPPPPPL